MNIGIDVRPLQSASRYRGIGRVLYNLLAFGKQRLEQHHLVFYAEKNMDLPEIIGEFSNAKINWIDSGFHKKRFIRAFVTEYKPITPSKDIDVFLQVEVALGIPRNTKSVAFFHDAIPLIFREEEAQSQNTGYLSLKRNIASHLYWRKYRKSLSSYKRASKIIAISKHSQKDLNKYVLRKNHIDSAVVYLSATPIPSSIKVKPSFVPTGKYLLYVGGIDYRKNVVGALRDFAKAREKHPDLKFIFVGKEFYKKKELDDFGWSQTISALGIAEHIITPGYVSDEELMYLYSHATAFIFPSLYEGFGLPVLEAMQDGCPVIAFKNSSIPEVAGDAALLVNDDSSMAGSIIRLLEEKGLREVLIKKGKLQAKKFSWEKAASETIDIIEQVGNS